MEALTHKQIRLLIPYHSFFRDEAENPRFNSICSALKRLNYQDSVYAVYNEFGLLSIACGNHESEALDNAVDCNALDSCLIPFDELDTEQMEQLESEGYVTGLTYLGNASELFDLTYISIREIV